jgi:putative addiction module component (TIGR02574 family)
MSMTKEQILVEAMALPATEREALAEQLLQSLTDEDRRSIDDAWLAEAHAREEAFAMGEMKTSAVDDVLERIKPRDGG